MRAKKPHSKSKYLKKRMRMRERIKRQEEEERRERDAYVTEEHGDKGHRVCGRKIRYDSEAKAYSRASECLYHGAGGLRAYRCPYCGGWHLTKRV